MDSLKEIELQNKIRIELSKHGIVFRRHVGEFITQHGAKIKIGVPGEADLEFIGKGFVAFIEVKTPTGKVRSEQENFLKKMQSLGHKTGIARSVEDALKIINKER